MTMPNDPFQGSSSVHRYLMALKLNAAIEPLHDWLRGELTYFRDQGYSDDQAHLMVCAEYVSTLGLAKKIPDWQDPNAGKDDDSDG